MTEFADDAELRRSRRRHMLRTLLMSLPLVAVWFVFSHWAAQHFHLRPSLVRSSTLLVFALAVAVMPRRVEDRLNGGWRETPRMRLLFGDRVERALARSHIGFGVSLAIILVATLGRVFTPESPHAQYLQSDSTLGLIVVMCINLRWQAGRIGDEGAQRSYLVATSRAFLATLVACMVAIVATGDRPARLLPAVEAALVLGCLTWQVSMAVDDRRAARDGD